MIQPQEIQSLIEKGIPGCEVTVEDMTGTGDHFQVIVLSRVFKGKMTIEQHRMVHDALAPMKDQIHALAIKTRSL
jgi:stress-induced morphogen